MYVQRRILIKGPIRTRTHGNAFLRFCIVYCSQGNREQPAHYLKQYKNAGKRFRVYGALGYVHTVSFSQRFHLFFNPLRTENLRKTTPCAHSLSAWAIINHFLCFKREMILFKGTFFLEVAILTYQTIYCYKKRRDRT